LKKHKGVPPEGRNWERKRREPTKVRKGGGRKVDGKDVKVRAMDHCRKQGEEKPHLQKKQRSMEELKSSEN